MTGFHGRLGASVGATVCNIWVGAAVGDSVGTEEIDKVGPWVGEAVGISLGVEVGIAVGYSVGNAVGAVLGTPVVGLVVVGALVGCSLPVEGVRVLGLDDGESVGTNVEGCCVGAGDERLVVGLTEGSKDGDTRLGPAVDSPLVQLQFTWKSNQPKGPLPPLAALYSSA